MAFGLSWFRSINAHFMCFVYGLLIGFVFESQFLKQYTGDRAVVSSSSGSSGTVVVVVVSVVAVVEEEFLSIASVCFNRVIWFLVSQIRVFLFFG